MRQGGGKKQKKTADDASEEEPEPVPEEKEEEYLDDLDEADRIKFNLKNSSNIYYKITHSIQDEVTT
jgi:hypothetical protein